MAEEAFAPLPGSTESGNLEVLMQGMTGEKSNRFVPKPIDLTSQVPEIPESKSPWPMIIAIGAAAEGNYNPLFQLSEQKRKTQVYNQAALLVKNTQERINRGEVDEGIAQFQEGMTRLGGRAPEISQFMAPMFARMDKIQGDKKNVENALAAMKARANTLKISGYPEAAQFMTAKANELKAIPYPMDTAALKDFMAPVMNPENRLGPGGNVITSSSGFEHITTPLKQFLSKDDVSTFAAQTIAKEYKLLPNQVLNVMNSNEPLLNAEGEDMAPMLKEAVQLKLAQAMATERDIGLQKLFPKPAEFNETLQATLVHKYGPEGALIRQATGQVSYPEYKAAQDEEAELWFRRNAASILATNRYDMLAARRVGLSVLDKDPNSPSFGQEIMIPPDEVAKRKDRFGYSGNETKKNVYEGLRALTGLRQIDAIFAEYQAEGTLNSALARAIAKKVHVSISPGTTASQIAEAIANDAIEQVLNSSGADSKEIADVKKFVTGKFADPSTAKASREVLEGRLKEILGKYMNSDITVEGDAIKRIEKAKPEVIKEDLQNAPLPEGAIGRTPGGLIIRPRKK